jgi:hypothetical protein
VYPPPRSLRPNPSIPPGSDGCIKRKKKNKSVVRLPSASKSRRHEYILKENPQAQTHARRRCHGHRAFTLRFIPLLLPVIHFSSVTTPRYPSHHTVAWRGRIRATDHRLHRFVAPFRVVRCDRSWPPAAASKTCHIIGDASAQSVVSVHSAAPIARGCILQHKHINKHLSQQDARLQLTSFPSQLCCVCYSSSTANSRTYICRCVPDAALKDWLNSWIRQPASNRFSLSGGVFIKRCIVCIYYSRLPREGRPHISS